MPGTSVSRRHANLHEHEVRRHLRQALQRLLDRAKPLGNSLRVVETIDPDADDLAFELKLLSISGLQGPAAPRHAVLKCDRSRRRWARCTTRTRRSPKNADSPDTDTPNSTLHRGEKILLIALHLKRDQIVGEQALEQLPAPRTDAQPIDVRPRNVPEQRRPQMRPLLPQVPGHEREVVIVQEDGRVLRRFRRDDIGKAAVHRLIRLPVLRVELRLHVRLVAQRPERAVRKARVVPSTSCASARPAAAGTPANRAARRRIPRIDHDAVSGAGSMRDPDPTALAHQRIERDRHSAGRMPDGDRSVGAELVSPGLAVGDDDEPAARSADFSGLGERRAEQNRAHDIVKRHGGDDERARPAAPLRDAPRENRCANPMVIPDVGSKPSHSRAFRRARSARRARAGRDTFSENAGEHATANAARPAVAIASMCIETPIAAKRSTSTGVAPSRMASSRTLRASSPGKLDDEARGDAGDQGLEVICPPRPAMMAQSARSASVSSRPIQRT